MSDAYIVAPAALDDINEIAAWMRRENPGSDVDLHFIDESYKAFEFMARRPTIGHRRPDLTNQPVLFWKVMRSFAVIYRMGPACRNRSHPALATRLVEPARRRRNLALTSTDSVTLQEAWNAHDMRAVMFA